MAKENGTLTPFLFQKGKIIRPLPEGGLLEFVHVLVLLPVVFNGLGLHLQKLKVLSQNSPLFRWFIGPIGQLSHAKVKNADWQDWYILSKVLGPQ